MVAIHDIMGAHILQVHALLLEELQGFVHILQAVDAHLALGGPWLRDNSGLVGMKGHHSHTRGGRNLDQLMPAALPFVFLVKFQIPPSFLTLYSFLHLFIYFHFYVSRCFACIYVSAPYACSVHRVQKRALDTLGLELQDAIRVLGIETGSSERVARA